MSKPETDETVLVLPLDEEVKRLSGEFATALAESGKAVPDITRNLAALGYYVGQLTSFAARLTGRERSKALTAVFIVIGEGVRDETAEAEGLLLDNPLNEAEEAELVDRINADPNLQPLERQES